MEGTSAGTVSSRSHSCMTDSPPPTLIQPGSHTHTRNIHIYTPDAVIGLMPQQPITLHAHWHECRFDESATGLRVSEQFLQRIHPNCCGFELIVAHSDAIIITVHYTDMSHVYVLHIGITVLGFRSGFAAHTAIW